jgi:hypothetical protein
MLWDQRTTNNDEFYFGLTNDGGGPLKWRLGIWAGRSLAADLGWTPTISLATWYHVALVRSGNSWYVFQDGSQVGSPRTSSASVADYTGTLYVGSYQGTALYFNGWLDEFRVTKGVARWTSNFTPPMSAYAGDSNTVLLLHMDGTDGSTTFTDDVTG